ncbi:MAG: tol-pal system protein YbgF [Gammaproteobacteria bacterium]
MANSSTRFRRHGVRRAAVAIAVIGLVAVAHAADPITERRLGDIDNRLNRLEGVFDNKVLLEMLQRIENLQRELQAARDATERTAYELEGIKDRQRELYLDIDRRLRALETAQPAASPAPQASGDTTASPPAGDSAPPASPAEDREPESSVGPDSVTDADDGQAYRDAFELLKDGQYEQSIVAFKRFLADHPQSTYAANAQYWLAEANYVSANYERAATEFDKVIEHYPDSSKVPDARLKLGFTYYELQQWEKARSVLTDVTRQHPNSTVARLAESRLQRMDREGN